MSMSLGGTTLADPVECSMPSQVPAGEYAEMLSGKLDFRAATATGYWRRWDVVWDGLTDAQYNTIAGAVAAARVATAAFVPPQGSSYTVRVEGDLTAGPSEKFPLRHKARVTLRETT